MVMRLKSPGHDFAFWNLTLVALETQVAKFVNNTTTDVHGVHVVNSDRVWRSSGEVGSFRSLSL